MKAQKFFATMFLLVVFGGFTTGSVMAQKVDIKSIARQANTREAAYARQGIIDDLPYPQAPGAIVVSRMPNGDDEVKVEYIFPQPVSGYVTAQEAVGNGTIPLQTYFFEKSPQNPLPGVYNTSMLLFEGRLLNSDIRFDVFQVEGGKVSKISKYVGCCGAGPRIGGITVSPRTIFVSGSFKNPTVAIGFDLTKISLSPFGISIQLPYELEEGPWTLTVCDEGLCSTKVFEYTQLVNLPGPICQDPSARNYGGSPPCIYK